MGLQESDMGLHSYQTVLGSAALGLGGQITMSAAAVDAANAAPLSGSKEMSLEEPKKMTREDWRKKKELGEQ